jgi:hypothetical protein
MVKLNVMNLQLSMRNFIFKKHLGFLPILLLFSQFAPAQSDLMGYAEFMPDRYTSNFKKGVQSTLFGSVLIDNEKISVKMLFNQKTGVVSKFAGKQWIKVGISGKAKFGSESVDVSLIQLYDPETKLKMYEIDVKDMKTKQFVWNSLPKLLPLGELLEVGSFAEKDNDGKLINMGKMSYKLARIENGFEFCQIDSGKDLETGESELIEDCDQFSLDKKLTGLSVKVKLGKDTEVFVSGKSVLR